MNRILPVVLSALLVASFGNAAYAKMDANDKAIAKECHKANKKDKAGYKKCVADKKATGASATPAAAPAAK